MKKLLKFFRELIYSKCPSCGEEAFDGYECEVCDYDIYQDED